MLCGTRKCSLLLQFDMCDAVLYAACHAGFDSFAYSATSHQARTVGTSINGPTVYWLYIKNPIVAAVFLPA